MSYFILAISIGSLAWLIFMIVAPKTWGALVDRENDFWVKRAGFPVKMTEWIKRQEKGMTLKVLVGFSFIMSSILGFKLGLPIAAHLLRH